MGFHSRGGRGVNAADAKKKTVNAHWLKYHLRNRCVIVAVAARKKLLVVTADLFLHVIATLPLFLIPYTEAELYGWVFILATDAE